MELPCGPVQKIVSLVYHDLCIPEMNGGNLYGLTTLVRHPSRTTVSVSQPLSPSKYHENVSAVEGVRMIRSVYSAWIFLTVLIFVPYSGESCITCVPLAW